jgi:carbon monoxide dehydrogenase subunit G
MAAIEESIEIARPPEDVFSYATNFSHFPEWQGGVVSVRPEGNAPLTVGSKAVVVRQLGPRKLEGTEEITELRPPRTWTVRGVGGRVKATARGTVESLEDGARSRVTIALEFEGHGIGKLLVPLVIHPQARRQLPKNEQRLKERLERES